MVCPNCPGIIWLLADLSQLEERFWTWRWRELSLIPVLSFAEVREMR